MRNCLVVLKNKKLCSDAAEYTGCVHDFAARGLYFDKIAVIAYDSSRDITAQLKECRSSFENTVVMCISAMEQTLKDYICPLYGGGFEGQLLDAGDRAVYLCFSDGNADCGTFAELINSKSGIRLERKYIKAIGAPRDKIVKIAEEAKAAEPSVEVNVFEKYGDFTIELVCPEGMPKSITAVTRMFATALDEYIYAHEDVSIAECLCRLLRLNKFKISCAESFTGGGVGRRIVEIPGASEVYYEGLNTYSNEAKKERLGVKDATLKTEGAVSAETAKQMANGLMWRGRCNVAVSTTGIAGPKSDDTLKPVGLCYIAVALKDFSSFKGAAVYKYNISGDRKTITETAINYALYLAYKSVRQNFN